MSSWKLLSCWAPVARLFKSRDDDDDIVDENIWSKDLDVHFAGEYSFAVVQGNEIIEDQSQVETGPHATFIGVYDGHGGAEASRYIVENLYSHLTSLAQQTRSISEEVIKNAFAATEDEFLAHVRREFERKPAIAEMGSCCLTGLIWNGVLYVANLGDSRAVIGRASRSNCITAEQLTIDHNASSESIRSELLALHPEDPEVVLNRDGAWRVKGVLQVTRAIGDAYLKQPEYSKTVRYFTRFGLIEPLRRAVLTAIPEVSIRELHRDVRFIIFASDGLWEHLTNKDAAKIVHNNPRAGIARKLVREAMRKAAQRFRMTYSEIKTMRKRDRRHVHDDITVVVVFIDHEQPSMRNVDIPESSVRGFSDTVGRSSFPVLNGNNSATSSSVAS